MVWRCNLHYEKFSDGTVKCIEDEIPFEIPDGWAWARLGTIAETELGKMLDASKNKGAPRQYLRNINVRWGSFDLSDLLEMRIQDSEIERYSICKGDLVVCEGGEPGRCAIWREDEPVFFQKALHRVRPFVASSEFLYYLFRAIMATAQMEKYYTGTTIKHLTGQALKSLPVPLPPSNEQVRIIEKLHQLSAFLDYMEKTQTSFGVELNGLKAKILDLAIRGKLVPQDPADEPASVLLERIRADKEEQIKAGKIKRDKKESFIFRGEDNSYYLSRSAHKEQVDAQFLFPLPLGWQWCTLSNVSHFELGKTLDQGKNTGDYYPYLRSANIKWDSIDLADLKEMRFEKEELDRYTIVKNDLLICEGGDVGRCCVWESANNIMYQNALHRVRFFENCNPFFFMFYMWHYELEGMLKPICNGVTIKHLTGDVLRSIPFALPPVEEQNRIVAKIREYFQIIEVLQ